MSETLYGNLKGLKSSQLQHLQQLYEEQQPSDRLISPELAQKLTAISTEIHHPVCCYINRRGDIVRVGVGTPQETQIHIRSVEEILDEIPTLPPKALIAFNKVDQVDSETLTLAQQQYPKALFISATQRLGLETLKQRLIQLINADVNEPLQI